MENEKMETDENFDIITISSNDVTPPEDIQIPLRPKVKKCKVLVGYFVNINPDKAMIVKPWVPCRMVEVISDKLYYVCFIDGNGLPTERHMSAYDLAEACPVRSDQILPHGYRVIAQRDPSKLPYRYKTSLGHNITLYNNTDNGFYPGFAGEHLVINNIIHTMVFFDDGHVQYIPNRDIRPVLLNNHCLQAPANARNFYKYYMTIMDDPRLFNHFKIPVPDVEQYLRIDLHCYWEQVHVYETQGELVRVFFMETNRYEWIWIGSPRIRQVWKAIMRDKNVNRTAPIGAVIDLDESSEEIQLKTEKLESDILEYNEGLPQVYSHPGKCTEACNPYEKHHCMTKYQALARPYLAGWRRMVHKGTVLYRTPCGMSADDARVIRTILLNMKSNLSLDCFSLDPRMNCLELYEHSDVVLIPDISEGAEELPIRVVGRIGDDFPEDFEYIVGYYIDSHTIPPYFWHPYRKMCCDCTDMCADKNNCACQRLARDNLMREYPDRKATSWGYKNGLLTTPLPTNIYECHAGCKCHKNCVNRVIQYPLRFNIEIFKTRDRGWGVRTLQDLPAGAYISHYTGDLLTESNLLERAEVSGDSYFLVLAAQSDMADADVKKPPAKKARRSAGTGDKPEVVIQQNKAFVPYFPLTINEENPKDKTAYSIDSRYRGNFTRFINHSCDPNLFIQLAYVDTHDSRFPWAALFTNRRIKAGEELTFSYGYEDLGRGVICKCGAKKCIRKLL